MSSRHQSTLQTKGFTIVELLIVVVVIAILAAITLVAFNGVRQQAAEAVLKTDLNQAAKQLAVANIQNSAYPADASAIKKSDGTTFQYTYTAGTNSYCLTAASSAGEYYISNDNTTPQSGVCPGHTSQAGVAVSEWTSLSAKSASSCGVSEGAAYCWGYGYYGRLGTGSSADQNTPAAVNTSVMSGTVTAIAIGGSHACAVAGGQAYCWGYGNNGQLGNGTPSIVSTPVAVSASVMSGTVTAISSGGSHTCAIASGQAYCWGIGTSGQLGDGTGSSSNVPVAVSTSVMSGTVTAIAAGSSHTCAIASGQMYCWGHASYGQLGNGSTSQQNSPVAVTTSLMSGAVTAMSAGSNHTCAVASGAAYCWGYDTNAQLGNGAGGNSNTPTAVDTSVMSGTVTAIMVGDNHSCAVASGAAYCWGQNTSGQLGDGTTTQQISPVAVNTSVMSGTVTAMSGGQLHTCALTGTTAYCWGSGSVGRLGNGSTDNSSVPVLVSAKP